MCECDEVSHSTQESSAFDIYFRKFWIVVVCNFWMKMKFSRPPDCSDGWPRTSKKMINITFAMLAMAFNAWWEQKGHTYLNKPAAASMCDLFATTRHLRVKMIFTSTTQKHISDPIKDIWWNFWRKYLTAKSH